MVPITQYIPQYEPVVVWGEAFTAEECDNIIKLGELREFERGRVGEDEKGRFDAEIRDSAITWLEPHESTRHIFERLDAIIGRSNFEKFQLDLRGFDGLQYTKYAKDGHYDWHTDVIDRPRNPELHRKLSLSVMLTDPDEYEGGELLFNVGGSQDKAISLKPKRGSIVMFYSYLPHKVVPVTKGNRVVLVTWILGSKLC